MIQGRTSLCHLTISSLLLTFAQPADFDAKLAAAGGKLVVVDFFATWCGPCKMIGPYMTTLAADPNYSNVVFLKVDVDEAEDVAQKLGVEAMPTFKFFKNNKKIDEMVGADKNKLKAIIDRHK